MHDVDPDASWNVPAPQRSHSSRRRFAQLRRPPHSPVALRQSHVQLLARLGAAPSDGLAAPSDGLPPLSSPRSKVSFAAPQGSLIEAGEKALDVSQAVASVEADRERILDDIRRTVGIDAVNSLFSSFGGGSSESAAASAEVVGRDGQSAFTRHKFGLDKVRRSELIFTTS